MFKRFFCILTTIAMVFCLSCGNIAGVIAVAEDYLEITSKGGTLVSGTYKLTEDVTISSQLKIGSDAEVTIDLNGYSVNGKTESVILVDGGILNLVDSSSARTGSVINTEPTTTSRYGIRVQNGGTLNMFGGYVSGSYGVYGYGSSSSTECTINITGGTIESTKCYALYNYKGSITISGNDKVTISALNETNTNSYGIYSQTSSITISNPNTYVSTKSTSKYAVYKQLKTNTYITAGHYSTDVSRYVNTDGYSCKESSDSDYPYIVTADASPVLYGKALTLDGEIGVTYYFDMTGVESPEKYELIASIGGTFVETVVAEPRTIDSVEYYRYTVYVSPTELDSLITAYLTDGTTTVTTADYSVYTYCERAIKNEDGTWDAEKPLCEALLNYGYYLETWLGETSTISISSLDGEWTDPLSETWNVNLSDYGKTANGVTGKTLALDGTGIFIRLNIDNPTSYYVEGIDSVIYGNDYLEFKVPARKMSEIFTICNSDGTTYTTYSIYSYIKNNVDSEDTNLANLCKAIYYYSEESIAYSTNWQ